MSFILDAIAKSEAERKQRDMPGADVLAFPGNAPPPKRRYWPYLVAIAALLLNGVLLFLLFGDEPTIRQTGSQAGVTLPPTPTPTPTNTVSVATSTPANNKTDTIGDNIDAGATIPAAPTVERPSLNEPATRQIEIASIASPPKASSGGLPALDASAVETVAAAATDSANEANWLRVEPDSLSREIGAAEQAAGGRQSTAPKALFNRVVLPSELPDNIRDQLPEVTFSGHLYSSNPKSSLVFVGNGRPVVTGQAIERDLILHEITPGGVVVKFRGYLIQVGLLQNWTLK